MKALLLVLLLVTSSFARAETEKEMVVYHEALLDFEPTSAVLLFENKASEIIAYPASFHLSEVESSESYRFVSLGAKIPYATRRREDPTYRFIFIFFKNDGSYYATELLKASLSELQENIYLPEDLKSRLAAIKGNLKKEKKRLGMLKNEEADLKKKASFLVGADDLIADTNTKDGYRYQTVDEITRLKDLLSLEYNLAESSEERMLLLLQLEDIAKKTAKADSIATKKRIQALEQLKRGMNIHIPGQIVDEEGAMRELRRLRRIRATLERRLEGSVEEDIFERDF